jgi:hypothetical protein
MVVLQKKGQKILEGPSEVASPRQPAPIMLFRRRLPDTSIEDTVDILLLPSLTNKYTSNFLY